MPSTTVGLVGNPNSGKSTLFNGLTGAHQRVGNWPGVTVEKKSGACRIDSGWVDVVDLPGLYSLEQDRGGLDESIASGFLRSADCDIILNIVDATNLERHLLLTQQLQRLGHPMLIVLNMVDVADRHGVSVDSEALSEALGVPVIPMVASRNEGLTELKKALSAMVQRLSSPVESTVDESDQPALEVSSGSTGAKTYFARAQAIGSKVVKVSAMSHTPSERIDAVVLNRWLGIPIFLLAMYTMFTLAINLGAVFIDFFDLLFGALFVDGTSQLLHALSAPEWLVALLADGLGGGIQLVATFIPVVGFLFLCLSIMEDSGYMARAAFVIDRLMISIGLPGNAFVPLIVGFGCNVPAVMASRSLPSAQDRLMTMAMAPFMSCGARLTVYALFATVFFRDSGQNIVFLLYLLGIGMAIFTGWIFRKQIFSGQISPSFAEMPVYHVPNPRNIFMTTWLRLKSFVVRAGRTILIVVLALSMLNSMALDGSFGHQDSDRSVLATIGKRITPLFAPMGIEENNWPATVGLFTGLFAKEAVVGTLDALYSGGAKEDPVEILDGVHAAFASIGENLLALADAVGDPLGLAVISETEPEHQATRDNMIQQFGGAFPAFCYLVFILLYAPCVAVVAAMTKEAGWRWSALVFLWTTGLGYLTATTIYQVGVFADHPQFSGLWIAGALISLTGMIILMKRLGARAASAQLIPVVQITV